MAKHAEARHARREARLAKLAERTERRRAKHPAATPAAAPTEAQAEQGLGARFLARYQAACYRILGARLERRAHAAEASATGEVRDAELLERLRQANYEVSPGLYRALLVVTTALGAVVAAAAATVLLTLLGPPAWWAAYAGGLAVLAALLIAGAFPATVGARISNRRSQLEKELPFSLSELSVLAAVGLAPITLMRRMARRRHDPAMTQEFRKVVHRTDMQGQDLVTALSETARQSPSQAVRDTLWDLSNMVHQGAALDEYLRKRSAEVLEHKRLDQKAFIERLTTYADMYVTVVLIGTMFLGIGAFLLDAFGSTAGGLSADGLLLLLTYGFLPLVVIVLSIVLNAAYQKAA